MYVLSLTEIYPFYFTNDHRELGTYFRWYSQNKMRTHEEKYVSSDKKNPICDSSRSNLMSYTDQITEIASYMRTYF